jgi:hypothetical protein
MEFDCLRSGVDKNSNCVSLFKCPSVIKRVQCSIRMMPSIPVIRNYVSTMSYAPRIEIVLSILHNILMAYAH